MFGNTLYYIIPAFGGTYSLLGKSGKMWYNAEKREGAVYGV